MKIKFKIVTPEKTVYENEVDQVTLPTLGGQVTILPNHRSYISSLTPGEIMLKKDKEEILLATSGGFIEFHGNVLVALADTAESADEIDLERAEQARKRAEEIKKEKISMSELEYARVAAAIEKEMIRVKVAKKHRSGRSMNLR